nr:MAG TPA: hypothetical protein [Caudoviricetes sp.]
MQLVTEEFQLDITNIESKILNRIIFGAELEKIILASYSTDKLKQAEIYNKVVEEAIKYLVGEDGKKHKIQLFEMIQENDFNTRFMEVINYLEWKVNERVGPFYEEVYVKSKEGSILHMVVRRWIRDGGDS